jgi:hypothetical protein
LLLRICCYKLCKYSGASTTWPYNHLHSSIPSPYLQTQCLVGL